MAAGGGAETLLSVRSLTVDISTDQGVLRAVDGVSFEVGRGQVLGLVGETGCGKSITALSVLGLLPRRARIVRGECRLAGVDLVAMAEPQLREVRGKRVAMIFQDPLTSLNPLMTVGDQIAEAIRLHERLDEAAVRARCEELLSLVRIPGAADHLRSYPHELSGGMRQRVMIAMAISNRPDLLIADEPTTALDVTTQAQVLSTLRAVQEEVGSGLILITHDLGVVADQADALAVMYDGRIVESGPTEEVLSRPAHPYTRALLGCRPRLQAGHLPVPIPGAPPRPFETVLGCAFAPRCDRADAASGCFEDSPALEAFGSERLVACHRPEALASGDHQVARPDSVSPREAPVVLEVSGLEKQFVRRARFLRRRSEPVRVLQGIDLSVRSGETLAIAGESGCGKSTAARSILRLIEPTSGKVEVLGQQLADLSKSSLRAFRRNAQIVLQDPYSSLDPRKTVGESIAEPLRVHRVVAGGQERRRVDELLGAVGLYPEHGRRFPNELSGGQRQRVCIARALGLAPKLLVLDEPVSALDVSVQAQILQLLLELQQRHQMAYLFITHDLAVVRTVADRVAVLYLGRIVEEGRVDEVFSSPRHPYTAALLEAVPGGRAGVGGAGGLVSGEPADPAHPPPGCPYAPRCASATTECTNEPPPLAGDGGGRRHACYHPLAVRAMV